MERLKEDGGWRLDGRRREGLDLYEDIRTVRSDQNLPGCARLLGLTGSRGKEPVE